MRVYEAKGVKNLQDRSVSSFLNEAVAVNCLKTGGLRAESRPPAIR